jgi:hypothetical protein
MVPPPDAAGALGLPKIPENGREPNRSSAVSFLRVVLGKITEPVC